MDRREYGLHGIIIPLLLLPCGSLVFPFQLFSLCQIFKGINEPFIACYSLIGVTSSAAALWR